MEISRKLENLKTNIIRWYNFKENSNILVVGSDTKTLCDFLEKKHNVKMLDSDAIFISNTKFDYIIIKEKISYLENLKSALAEDGTILLLLNNRFGVAYLAGIDGFETLFGNKYGYLEKAEIEEKIEKAGYTNYRFFYPLPSYDYANAIYSDEYLPEYTDSKLANNNVYLRDNVLVFDEIELLRSFTETGDFKRFTNSYLVEINPQTTEKAIFFNNVRKDEYKLITKIFDGEVHKEIYDTASQNHINNIKSNVQDLSSKGYNVLDRVENNKIISKFVTFPNMYREVITKIKSGKAEEVINILKNQFEYAKEKFTEDRTTEINKDYFRNLDASNMFCVKRAYIDLVFENMFIDNEKLYIYDQEWEVDNCPLEFILFRTILNLYMMDAEIEYILPRNSLLEKFGILKYWDEFYGAEISFQNQVLDQDMVKIYNKKNELRASKDEIMKARENAELLGIYKSEELKKGKCIEELQKDVAKLQEEVARLQEELKNK